MMEKLVPVAAACVAGIVGTAIVGAAIISSIISEPKSTSDKK
jgi:hypothetical protein